MYHYYKTLAMIVTLGILVTLTGCIVEPNKYNAHGTSNGSYNQPNSAGKASGPAEYDRGCGDAKSGSYDRSGNASQAYEDGWNACHNSGNQSNAQQQGGGNAREYDRGCSDAKSGSYDRSGNAGQAYEDGWNACHNNGDNQSGAQPQAGVNAARKTCLFQFGGSGRVQMVSDLKPGFWEIIVIDNSGRKVACTADAQGNVSDWVEM